jgi:hypothetical protein
MKKEYIIPVTEMMEAELGDLIMDSFNLYSDEEEQITEQTQFLVRSQMFLLDD